MLISPALAAGAADDLRTGRGGNELGDVGTLMWPLIGIHGIVMSMKLTCKPRWLY